MRFAPEKNEEAADFRISVDHDAVSKAQVRYDGAMEFGAIAIGVGVDGSKHFDVKDGSLREGIERIRLCVTQASL
jgi:imidazole glycerol phosphate synthase subunit HisF